MSIATATWFELRGDATQTIELAPNEVRAAYIPITVLEFGEHDFEVSATGSEASDAILRTVEVVPNGRPQAG